MGDAVAPPLSKTVVYAVADLLFLLVLQSPIGLYAGKEVAVFHAPYFEGDGNADGVDTSFVLDAIGFDNDPEILYFGACKEAEVFIEIIVIISAGVEHPGEPGDAEFLIALVGIVYFGDGKLGYVEVDTQVAGMGRGGLGGRTRLGGRAGLGLQGKNEHK